MIHINIEENGFDSLLEKHKKYLSKRIGVNYKKLKSNEESAKNIEFLECYLKCSKGSTDDQLIGKLVERCIGKDIKTYEENFNKTFNEFYNVKFTDIIVKNITSRIENGKKEKILKARNLRETINRLLDYDGFNDGTEDWNRHTFLSSLNVKVCPYCNRNYITSYQENISRKRNAKTRRRTTSDADHYYPKSLYPILQMNLYNLIPSCGVCNSRLKSSSNKRHLHPYVDSSDCLKFAIKLETPSAIMNDSIEANELIVEAVKETEKSENSKDVFKLEKVYAIHDDVIHDLRKKIDAYNNFKEDYYDKMLGEEIGGEIALKGEIHQFWFDFLHKDALSEPLLKLKQDIYNQFMLEHK